MDLIAFFLVTPEIMGERRLRTARKIILRVLFVLSVLFFVLAVLAGIGFFLLGFVFMRRLFINADYQIPPFVSTYPVWTGIGSMLLSWFALLLMRLYEKVVESKKLRSLIFRLGIVVLVLGVLVQFIGTFL